MKILTSEENLNEFLEGLQNKDVVIISAFASGTEEVVDTLLNQGNKLELLIGTINSFSSPDFFEHCKKIADDRFSMSIDFRYQNSIHWKLYLVKPDTVIIGSANFTTKGLSLERDTCVALNDKNLLEKYLTKFDEIKSLKDVLSRDDERFEVWMQAYREVHRRMQFSRVRTVHSGTVSEWLADEENQLIQLFIWEAKHTKSTTKEAHRILRREVDKSPASILREFFTWNEEEGGIPYKQGDLVLCIDSNGSYPNFYSFDRIILKNGTNYIYSYKQKRYARPFRLEKELKRAIKNRAKYWFERNITEIHRNEIEALVNDTMI